MREDLRAIRRILPLLGVNWPRIALAMFLGVVTIGSSIGLAAVSAWLIVRASQMPPVLDLTIATVSVRALGISRGVFRYLERIASHDVALRGVVTLRERVYLTLADGRSEKVAPWRRGEVMRRLGTDVDIVSDLMVRAVIPAGVAIGSSLVSVAILAAYSPRSALLLAAMLAFTGIVNPMVAAAAARRNEEATLSAQGRISAASVAILDGATELRVQGRLDPVLTELHEAESAAHHSIDQAARPLAWAHASQVLAMGVSVVGALLIAIPEMTAGQVSAVALGIIVLTPLTAFEATATMPEAGIESVRSAAAARRILQLLDTTQEHSPSPTQTGPAGTSLKAAESVPALKKASSTTPSSVPAVESVGLGIGWPNSPVLLSKFDVNITPGESLVITGASGCGKTTLLLTLAGLLPPREGTVLLNGISSAALADGQAASIVTYTAEDAHIFDTTILENLRVVRGDLTEAQAWEALEQVKIASLVRSLPEGIHTRIGSGASEISGGERRRLLVARALVSKAPFLFFDEPTEHLDPQTGTELLHDILGLAHSRGIVVVTHHLAGIDRADRIIDLAGVISQEK